jgi:hypothetical protein
LFDLQLGKIKSADSSFGKNQSRYAGNTAYRQVRQVNFAEARIQLLSNLKFNAANSAQIRQNALDSLK